MDEWDILNAKMDAKKGMDEWDILNAKMDANPRVQSPATPKQPSPKPRLSLLEKALDLLMRPIYAGAETLGSLEGAEGSAPDWKKGLVEGLQGKRKRTYTDIVNLPIWGVERPSRVVNIPNIPDLPSQIPFIGGSTLRENISGHFDVNTLMRSFGGELMNMGLYPIPGGGAVTRGIRMIPGGAKGLKVAGAGIKAVSEAPGIKQGLQLLNTRIGLPKTYAEAREVYKDLKDLKKWEQLEQTRKEVKVLPKLPEREAAATRIEAGQKALTPAEQQFADLMKIKSEEMGKEESMRGLLSAQRTGYIAHLEEPPKKAGLPGLLGQREESAFAGGRTSGAGEEGLIGPAKWEIERKLQTIADYDRFYWVRDPKHERGWRAIEKKPGQAIPEDAVTIQAITDPARAMGIRGQSYVQRTLAHDFLYGTPEGSVFPKQSGILNNREIAIPVGLKEEFKPKDVRPKDWRNWERIVPDNRFPDKTYFVLKDVKNDLLQTVKAMSDPRGVDAMFDTIGKAIDLPTNVWKLWATAQNPGFHFRNMLGNFFNQYLAGVTDFNQTTKLGMNFWKPLKFEAKQGSFIVTKGGRKIPGSDVLRWGNENGVIKREFLYGEFNPAIEKEIQKATSGGLPAVGEVGKGFGQAIETQARLNLFIDGLRKDMTPFNAAMRVKKYLFDYGDLTAPERQLMRRVFPFYTWARKNIPLQFEHLITHSDKYQKLATVIDSWKSAAGEVSEEEQKLQPEYFRDLAAFKTPLGSKEVPLYFNPNLPMQDINMQPGRDWLTRLNPLAKAPIELRSNYQAYFDRELARGVTEEEKHSPGWLTAGRKVAPTFPGVEQIPDWAKAKLGIIRGRTKQSGPERWVVPPRVNYMLSQLPFLANVGKARPEVADEYTPWQTLSFLAGIKLLPLDIEKQRQWKQIDARKDQLEQAKRRGLEAR